MDEEQLVAGGPRAVGQQIPLWCRWLLAGLALLAVGRSWLPADAVGQSASLLVTSSSAALAWTAVLRGRRGGSWTAAGVALSALGDGVWQALDWAGAPTDASVADIAYLTSYLAIGMGLRRVLSRAGEGARFDRWVDTAAVFLVVVYLEWVLVLHGSVGDPSLALFNRALLTAYPVLDAWLLALVVRLWFARASLRAEAGWLAGGAVALFVSDLGYLVAVDSSALLDVGWTLGSLALTASLWVAGAAGDGARGPQRRQVQPVSRAQLAVALGPLALPGVAELIGFNEGRDVDPAPGMVLTGALLVLAFGRAARLSRQQVALRTNLELRARRSAALAADSADALVVVDAAGEPLAGPGRPAPSVAWAALGASAPDRRASLLAEASRAPGSTITAELPGGDDTWIEARVTDRSADPDVRGLVVSLQDVTGRRRARDELAYQAFHDALTGLPNRALFDDRIDHALSRSVRSGAVPTVLALDLDGFKSVNDTLGHPAGDDLLRQVADRLLAHLRPTDTVARLGGDEFVVLLEPDGSADPDEPLLVANRLVAVLSAPYLVAERAVQVGVSIGLLTADPDRAWTAVALLRDADTALYAAKGAGKGRVVVFEPAMRSELLLRAQLAADLPAALGNGELRVVYQPVVDIATGDLQGFEALLRWDHPVLGEVPPDTFIPVSEQNGTIEVIGRWVLREACSAAATWRAAPGAATLTIAVNLSVRQLQSPRLVADVAATLEATGLAPSALCLELTETALVQDADQAADTLDRLKSLGVRLAVDDFGTGYSSMTHLRRFPIDMLKIDRSFIGGISPAAPTAPVVGGLLELARVMGLEVVAEGVESVHQRDHLRTEGCRSAQGWLYSRALDRLAADQQVAGMVRRDGSGPVDPDPRIVTVGAVPSAR